MHFINTFKLHTLIIILFLSGCSNSTNPEPTAIDKLGIEYTLQGSGSQTIVFENGLGVTQDEWDDVTQPLSKKAKVLTYNRHGYGKSKPVHTERDASHIVNELRTLLAQKGLKPPYILVGHSLGGLYVQYFAKRYPQEVKGVVLVDSTHPTQLEGTGSYENLPVWWRGVFQLAASKTTKNEFDNITKSGQDVLAMPVSAVPMVILSANENSTFYKELSDHAHAKRVDFLRLYPHAKQVWVDSGHMITTEKPGVVIHAIEDNFLKNY